MRHWSGTAVSENLRSVRGTAKTSASAPRRFLVALMTLLCASCARPVHFERSTTAWLPVWREEFDGPAGAPVSSASWVYESGDGCRVGICGWGNQEKESYSSSTENVSLDGEGHLALVVRKAPAGLACYYGPCRYSSGRIKTKGKVSVQPGRVEARIRIPSGQGLWPAFWLLGAAYPETPWPRAGELDVMENHGSNPRSISSAIHGPGYSGSQTPFVHDTPLPTGRYSDDFHLFAVEWDSTRVRFLVDDVEHYVATRTAVEAKGAWVFDQPFFVILNLAIGGHFDGDPASDAMLPATMLVDFVRVYVRR